MKIRLQVIGLGGVILSLGLIGVGAIALHSDISITTGACGFLTSTFIKCLGDAYK